MFELNKKQVGAVIKILGNHPERPMMEYLRIDTMTDQSNLVAVATNGFVMAVLQTGLEADTHKDLVGKGVHVSDLKQWYATADGKDEFSEEKLTELAKDLNRPLDWQQILPTEPAPIDHVALNPHLMLSLETIVGQPLVYTTYGEGKPLVAKQLGTCLC